MTDDGQCHCDKKQYSSRKTAKIAARKAFPGEHLSPYKCGHGWHIGHLPARVIAGDKDRNEIPIRQKRPAEYEPLDDAGRKSNLASNRSGRRRRG